MPAKAGQTALSGSQIKPPALPEVHDWDGVQATLDMMVSDTPGVKNVKARQLFDLTVLEELERAGFIDGLYVR